MKFRRSTVLLASIALAACAAGPVRDAGPLHPAHDAESASSPALSGFVVAHAFHHEVKSAGGVQRQFVEHGWDYDRAVAVERISTPEGMLIARTDKPGLILRATDQELDVAVDLVRRHPELADTVAVQGAEFEGGFIHMLPDDPLCHLQSRCVYVLVSLDGGRRKIAQALVDLQSSRVAYPRFDPVMIDD